MRGHHCIASHTPCQLAKLRMVSCDSQTLVATVYYFARHIDGTDKI